MAKEERLFDKRVIERNIKSGLVTREEQNKHLKSLKDLSDQATKVEAEFNSINRELPKRSIGDEDEEL